MHRGLGVVLFAHSSQLGSLCARRGEYPAVHISMVGLCVRDHLQLNLRSSFAQPKAAAAISEWGHENLRVLRR